MTTLLLDIPVCQQMLDIMKILLTLALMWCFNEVCVFIITNIFYVLRIFNCFLHTYRHLLMMRQQFSCLPQVILSLIVKKYDIMCLYGYVAVIETIPTGTARCVGQVRTKTLSERYFKVSGSSQDEEQEKEQSVRGALLGVLLGSTNRP